MSKPDNEMQSLAREAVGRVEAQRELGQQLSLLPGEPEAPAAVEAKVGRPSGSKNKGSSQLREWLVAKGLRMPEDQLVQIAGLASGDDVITTVIAQAERILAWAGDGASNQIFKVGVGHVELVGPWKPTPGEKMDLFKFLYTATIRANEAIMPYVAPKATPDVNVTQNTTVIVPSAPQAAPDPVAGARDVTPPRAGRMMPANVARKNEQNQQDSQSETSGSDAESRTE